jgi:hypothetical protein
MGYLGFRKTFSVRSGFRLNLKQRQQQRAQNGDQLHELQLTFAELVLIYKSLQAAKTLGALPPQDELLNDTIQLLDQTLNRASDAAPGIPHV